MKNSLQYYSLKNQLNMEVNLEKRTLQSPKKRSIDLILAYSKSLEARSSRYMDKMLLTLN